MMMDNSGLRYPRICLNIFSQLFCSVLQTLCYFFSFVSEFPLENWAILMDFMVDSRAGQ